MTSFAGFLKVYFRLSWAFACVNVFGQAQMLIPCDTDESAQKQTSSCVAAVLPVTSSRLHLSGLTVTDPCRSVSGIQNRRKESGAGSSETGLWHRVKCL